MSPRQRRNSACPEADLQFRIGDESVLPFAEANRQVLAVGNPTQPHASGYPKPFHNHVGGLDTPELFQTSRDTRDPLAYQRQSPNAPTPSKYECVTMPNGEPDYDHDKKRRPPRSQDIIYRDLSDLDCKCKGAVVEHYLRKSSETHLMNTCKVCGFWRDLSAAKPDLPLVETNGLGVGKIRTIVDENGVVLGVTFHHLVDSNECAKAVLEPLDRRGRFLKRQGKDLHGENGRRRAGSLDRLAPGFTWRKHASEDETLIREWVLVVRVGDLDSKLGHNVVVRVNDSDSKLGQSVVEEDGFTIRILDSDFA
ncbi:hypothetical protein QBC35DRAFT_478980 [Podospora australis]|uniref:Uncharacterized protein n=1 Tax=Podospora australis TaxID=1536484 RepID=A0AAN7ADH1_9PEZI|nr:hypothetical protein QBC35DRAFT_478980 [Podospora australis]